MSRFNSLKCSALTATAFAAFSLATLAPTAPANARHGHGFHGHGFHGVGLTINLGDGYSSVRIGPSCRYYYKKWTATGYDYWWDRYEACRSGY